MELNEKKLLTRILNALYPVGTIYMSATLSTPEAVQAKLGGTWIAWGAGHVPVGFDANDTDFNEIEHTGGAKTVALTVSQIPSHVHEVTNDATYVWVPNSSVQYNAVQSYNQTTIASGAMGGGQPHNNMQPYIICYMWKRIA